MWILLFGLTSGLVASSWANSVQDVMLRGCSYVGVFHIQGNDRYTLNFEDAQNVCETLGTALASLEQVTAAHAEGLESCRYGWVSNGNITIPRHEPNFLCAVNMTGVITISAHPDSHYDAFCYNKSDLSVKNCEYEIKYRGNEPQPVDNNESQDLNPTMSPSSPAISVTSVEIQSNNTATELSNSEKTNFTLISTQDEHDESTTQPSVTNTIHAHEDITIGSHVVFNIQEADDSTGSGMGETTNITPSGADTDDTRLKGHDTTLEDDSNSQTELTTVNEPMNKDHTELSRGRMGSGIAAPPEEPASSGGSDWLVILLVVMAVVFIILVAVLVVTRNRWCGRSQTLMITSKSSSEGNGTAASAASPQAQEREQEMVTLMNKEKIQENGNTEEFTVVTLEESPEKNTQA